MLDSQFSNQNGTQAAPGSNQGISVVVAPPGLGASPEHNKWIQTDNVNKNEEQGKKLQLGDKMTTGERIVLFASEVVATAILVFLGCAGCLNFSEFGGSAPTHLSICLTFGLAVMISVQCFGHVSGSHINPLVTVAAATLGNIPLIQVPIYFLGQFVGAFAGFGLLKVATPDSIFKNSSGGGVGVCSPGLNAYVSPFQGFLIEFTISLMLALVCCGVWDCRNNTKHDSVPIRFGLTIAVLALAGGPFTGGNMNPARSFAPAVINGDWENHWVYWIGPILGGFVAALVYRFLFAKEVYEEDQNNVAEVIPLNDKA